jgi:hypothetical protein
MPSFPAEPYLQQKKKTRLFITRLKSYNFLQFFHPNQSRPSFLAFQEDRAIQVNLDWNKLSLKFFFFIEIAPPPIIEKSAKKLVLIF